MCRDKAKEKNITVAVEGEKNCIVFVNPSLIEQTLINLIDNAVKYSNENTSIEIKTEKHSDIVSIAVSDQGQGIPKEHINKIKKPFFSTKRDQGGTGLGLHVSESIVEEHKGILSFKSAPGKGTEATISLPAEEGI